MMIFFTSCLILGVGRLVGVNDTADILSPVPLLLGIHYHWCRFRGKIITSVVVTGDKLIPVVRIDENHWQSILAGVNNTSNKLFPVISSDRSDNLSPESFTPVNSLSPVSTLVRRYPGILRKFPNGTNNIFRGLCETIHEKTWSRENLLSDFL